MISRMFASKARTHRPPVPRLRLDRLEERDVPATWNPGSGSDYLATTANNWNFGYGESISYFRTATFNSGNTAPCLDFSGDFDAININPGYTGTITLDDDLSVVMFYQGDGTIDQPLGSGSEITITQWWGWEGGTLNSTSTASSVTLDGTLYPGMTSATISPRYSDLSSGSTLNFINGSSVTFNPGTLNITGGDGINIVDSSCYSEEAAQPPPGPPPPSFRIVSAIGGAYVLLSNPPTPHWFNIPWQSDLPFIQNGGDSIVAPGIQVEFKGTIAQPTTGATYSISLLAGNLVISNTATLKAQSGTYLHTGKLATRTISQEGSQVATLIGNLRNAGADIVIGDPAYSGIVPTEHVFGKFVVEGTVWWTGGTYRPYINAALNSQECDVWESTGTFSINGPGTNGAKIGQQVLYLPEGTTVGGRLWSIITSRDSTVQVVMDGLPPTFDDNGVQFENDPPQNQKAWRIKGK